MSTAYTVCRECPVLHYEDCPDCWGFGVHADQPMEGGGLLPVRAALAIHEQPPANAVPCPTCGSTVAGVPVGDMETRNQRTPESTDPSQTTGDSTNPHDER